MFPEILRTWDFERNDRALEPSGLSRLADGNYGPDFQGFWWKCDRGEHSYPMKIRNRLKGSRCLVCSGLPVAGVNDLFSTFPKLHDWWDIEGNKGPPPKNIRLGERSVEYVWRCAQGHLAFRMDARNARRSLEEGIPLCEACRMLESASGHSVVDLFPELNEYWSPRNALSSEHYSYGTNKRVLWSCPNGHEDWEATPKERKFGRRLCPCCPGSHKLVVGCNDLATTHPRIASRWDYTRNTKRPDEVKLGTNAKFFFTCDRDPDHHPRMWVPSLRLNEEACTYCYREPVVCPQNDLACSAPDTFSGWDFEKNKVAHPGVNPHSIRPTDERVFFWHCPNGRDHSYERAVYNKNRGLIGCTICRNRVIVPGQNSLRDLFPKIAAEWLPQHNAELLPLTAETAPPAGGAIVKWTCSAGEGHPPYPATIWNRTAGETGCPSCATFGYKRALPGLLYFVERDDTDQHRAGRKIGISNVHSSRIRLRHWSYIGFRVVHTIEDQDGGLIEDLEKALLADWIRAELGLGQWFSNEEMSGGATETFSPFGPSNQKVVARMNLDFERLSKASGRLPD